MAMYRQTQHKSSSQVQAWDMMDHVGVAPVFMRRLTRSTRWQASFRIGRMALALTAGLAALGAGGWFWLGGEAALKDASRSLIEALRAEQPNDAWAAFAGSEKGAKLLQSDISRVLADGKAAPQSDSQAEHAATSLAEALERIRTALAAGGADWSDIRPLAFGGVRAQVKDPATMRDYATIVTGEVYFSSRGAVFAVEFTARKCDSAYVITDVWRGTPVQTPKEKLAAFSNKRFREFTREPDDPGDATRIRRSKHLFFIL